MELTVKQDIARYEIMLHHVFWHSLIDYFRVVAYRNFYIYLLKLQRVEMKRLFQLKADKTSTRQQH